MSIRARIDQLRRIEMEILNMISAENMKIYDKISQLHRIRAMMAMPASALIMRGINIGELIQRARMLEQEIERERRAVAEMIDRRRAIAAQILELESRVAEEAYRPILTPPVSEIEQARRMQDIEFLMQELREALARGDRRTVEYIRRQLRGRGVWWI